MLREFSCGKDETSHPIARKETTITRWRRGKCFLRYFVILGTYTNTSCTMFYRMSLLGCMYVYCFMYLFIYLFFLFFCYRHHLHHHSIIIVSQQLYSWFYLCSLAPGSQAPIFLYSSLASQHSLRIPSSIPLNSSCLLLLDISVPFSQAATYVRIWML